MINSTIKTIGILTCGTLLIFALNWPKQEKEALTEQVNNKVVEIASSLADMAQQQNDKMSMANYPDSLPTSASTDTVTPSVTKAATPANLTQEKQFFNTETKLDENAVKLSDNVQMAALSAPTEPTDLEYSSARKRLSQKALELEQFLNSMGNK